MRVAGTHFQDTLVRFFLPLLDVGRTCTLCGIEDMFFVFLTTRFLRGTDR